MAYHNTTTVNETTVTNATSRSSFDARLKDEILPSWDDSYHKKVVLAKLIAEKKGTMGGRRSIASLMTQPPQSAGIALRENVDLPTPRTGSYSNPVIFSRAFYTRLRRTGHVERAAKAGDKVAWAKPVIEELRGARIQGEINFSRNLYLGPRQLLATASAYTDSGSPNLMTLYGRDARTSVAADRNKYGAHYLRVNQSIQTVATVDGVPTNLGEVYITAIDNSTPTAPTLVFDTDIATDPSDGAFLIPFNSRDPTATNGDDSADDDSYYAGCNGLMNMVVDRSIKAYLYSLLKSANPYLEGQVFANGSGGVRPWKDDYLVIAADQIQDEGCDDEPNTVLCHKSIRREYVKAIEGDRRFPEVIKERGFGKLRQVIGDVMLDLVTDRDCMPGVMWVLETEGFGWFSECDMQMVDDGTRFVTDKDAHEDVYVKSGNCATKKPNNNAMIDDILYSVAGTTTAP